MLQIDSIEELGKPEQYASLLRQAQALMQGERDLVANAANIAALYFHSLAGVNWFGFYFWDGETLVVGPFQGHPACVRIALGKGVCGTAAATGTTQVVPDVRAFPGHIPCDNASRSEIVIPLRRSDGSLLGVLDVDSPLLDRFDNDDRVGLEALAAALLRATQS